MGRHHHIAVQTRVPIPPDLPPQLVLSALQAFTPLLDNHPFIQEYDVKPITPADVADICADPFFEEKSLLDPSTFVAVDVWEDVYTLGWLFPFFFSSFKRFSALGQRIKGGIRFRIESGGGLRTCGTIRVLRRGSNNDKVCDNDEQIGEAEWDIVCVCDIEMPIWFRLANRKLTSLNRRLCEELCEDVIEEAIEDLRDL